MADEVGAFVYSASANSTSITIFELHSRSTRLLGT